MPLVNLTKVLSPICKKCGGSNTLVARHHKGYESFAAALYPEVFAEEYKQFRPVDVVRLCRNCHLEIHYLYSVILGDIIEYPVDYLTDTSYQAVSETPSLLRFPNLPEVHAIRRELRKFCHWWLKHG